MPLEQSLDLDRSVANVGESTVPIDLDARREGEGIARRNDRCRALRHLLLLFVSPARLADALDEQMAACPVDPAALDAGDVRPKPLRKCGRARRLRGRISRSCRRSDDTRPNCKGETERSRRHSRESPRLTGTPAQAGNPRRDRRPDHPQLRWHPCRHSRSPAWSARLPDSTP